MRNQQGTFCWSKKHKIYKICTKCCLTSLYLKFYKKNPPRQPIQPRLMEKPAKNKKFTCYVTKNNFIGSPLTFIRKPSVPKYKN